MNEALRQSTYVGPAPSAPPAPAEVAPTRRTRDDRTDPHFVAPTAPPPPSSSPRKQPMVFSGEADDGDLWNLVQPSSSSSPGEVAPQPARVQSFEEALRRVDSSLEALVGGPPQNTRPNSNAEAIAEPIIEEAEPTRPGVPTPRAPNANVDMEPTDSADEGRLRRQRLLKRAMENLGQMPTNPSGIGIVGSSGSGLRSSGSGLRASPGIASSGSGLQPAPPAAAPPPTAAEQQLATQIETRFEQASKRDHFLTLGLVQTASKDQVKTAYLSLAKVFHPDRLPPSLPHLAQKMSTVFEAIREAYEVLFDDAKRSAYAATRANQAAAASPAQAASQQASDLLKMGEVFFKKRDYRQAEDHYARAYALDKGATSLAAQAWAIFMDPSRKAEGPQAKALMQRALTIDANCDRAHYQLGVIARVEGDMERAEKHFRDAVKANPRHLEANQELRLIDMRKKKAADPAAGKKGPGGFFR
jgi:tetratricopeptide (TPR) repeat protein